jgi:SAM-dependent methyltransferase
MASDLVMSSYSTSLIEAAVDGKPIYMIEPSPFPDSLYCSWYNYVSRIATANDFEKACLNSTPGAADGKLKSWAEKNLLAYGDPVERLAGFIHQLVEQHKRAAAPTVKSNEVNGLENKKYFNPITHENDVFEDHDIEQRVGAWMRTMGLEKSEMGGNQLSAAGPNSVDIINKTMSRADLLSTEARPVVEGLNSLITELSRKNLSMSSWVGSLPSREPEKQGFFKRLRNTISRSPHQPASRLTDPKEGKALERGLEQRLNYLPLANSADDVRFPWFLYWEIFWVLKVTRQFLNPGSRILDGGGSASLFTCYMASLGYEVHCVELNQKLNAQSQTIAEAMKYKLFPYDMDLRKLDFPDGYFDHAFSICVFEHLDYEIKQAALAEISRCLKPGGIFSITFDYRNPAPGIVGYGKDTRPKNQLKTEDDIRRNFLSSGFFELMGNRKFIDNGESYLLHQRFGNTPYTFGAIFLQKKSPGR